MKRGPAIHAILLVIALAVALQTWTKEEEPTSSVGQVLVWENSKRPDTVRFTTKTKTVLVEERKDGESSYLWGSIERRRKKPKPKADAAAEANADAAAEANAEADAAAEAEAEAEYEVVSTREFPVGRKGKELFDGYKKLMALRSLGKLSEEKQKEYGIAKSTESLEVGFGNDTYSLTVGDRVFGGTDRYVVDGNSSEAFVIASKLIQPLNAGESNLDLDKLHAFEDDVISQAVLKTDKAQVIRMRTIVEAGRSKRTVWGKKESPTEHDQTFSNFLDRLRKLKASRYNTELKDSDLQRRCRLEYLAKDGKALGFIEFYKQETPPSKEGKPPKIDYFIRTERTRVFARVNRLNAERVDQDLAQIFADGEGEAANKPAP